MKFLLAGGLGNQLSIAHAALYTAQETSGSVDLVRLRPPHGDTLHPSKLEQVIDLSKHNNLKLRQESKLGHLTVDFRIRQTVRGLLDAKPLRNWQHLAGITRVEEEGFSGVNHKGAWIQGHFQTFKYRELLRAKPEIRVQSPSPWFSRMVSSGYLEEEFWGGMHIRRGDYKNLALTFGLLSPNYYARALAKADLTGARVAVYTDDPHEARQVIDRMKISSSLQIIDTKEATDAESLYALSKHKVLICANSTFSLWAGILASESGSKVFRPSLNYLNRAEPFMFWPHNWEKVEAEFENS